jgi:CubicO group peptidase (beta-lactamase class C family)
MNSTPLPPLSESGTGTHGSPTQQSLVDRLNHVTNDQVRTICNVSGVAGMSVGVMHHGEVIFNGNVGLRDAVGSSTPNSETIYCIGSLTKAFTAAAITRLLDDHVEVNLDTPVHQILPEYWPKDKQLLHHVSLGDFLSHRSGLLGDCSFAYQGNFELLMPPRDLFPTVDHLKTISPLRRKWSYNNWGYSIAGAVIEQLSGKSYADYLTETVLKPLGLTHTTCHPSFGPEDNVANPHVSLSNAKPLSFENSSMFGDSPFEAAGGLYSNVDDMLKWAKAVLKAEKDPSSSPLKDMSTMISNQIPLDDPSHDSRFYGLGWIRTQLPGVVGLMGDNADLFDVKDLPVLGAGTAPMMVYYHQCSAPGYYAALLLFPETESAIVVLTNTLPLNDAADWIAQVYASTLFDFPEPADYVAVARESARRRVAGLDHVVSHFEDVRQDLAGVILRRLPSEYTGQYFSTSDTFKIEIHEHPTVETSLEMSFQGRESQCYELRYLHDDVFEWAMSADESARRGRFPVMDPKYFEVSFRFDEDNRPSALTWAALDHVLPEGILMWRWEGRD